MSRLTGGLSDIHFSSLTDYNAKSTACLTKFKRIFLLILVVTFGFMFMMYATSGETYRITLTSFKSPGSVASEFVSRRLHQINSFINANNSDSLSGVVSNSSLNGSSNLNESFISEQRTLEFPGMPDPCAKPRRKTGVEDILCMERPKFLPDYKNPCWYDDKNQFRCLPYFHLFGVCKSGTSDLFKRILLHPELVPNKGIFGKELWYWSWNRFDKRHPAMTLKGFTDRFYSNRLQDKVDGNGYHPLITGHGDPMDFWDRFAEERTPQNTPGAEELLWTTPYSVRHVNPNVKLILMLRDPIDRLYSHYFHSGAGTSAVSFDEHIRFSIPLWKECLSQHTIRSCIYNPKLRSKLKAPIYTSFYSVHMKEWLKVFPKEQIHILRNEDYSTDMGGTLKALLEFLDVTPPNGTLLDQMVSLPHFYETKGKKSAGPMLNSTRELLVDLYRPYTEELAQILGDQKFSFKDASFR